MPPLCRKTIYKWTISHDRIRRAAREDCAEAEELGRWIIGGLWIKMKIVIGHWVIKR